MSIWKSPVFYFGILLVLLVVSALAAPFVVPWNNYRADLQSYGERLTGRTVSIGGDIAVRLFPWPQLEARDVAIGNPDGFPDGELVMADSLRVKLSLGGLFSGRLDVESVEVVSPQVNLQRNASGNVNWVFAPRENVTGRGLLSRVKLDQITLVNGIVSYDDLKNGHSTVFTGLDATLSAQSILGPWRMRGEAKWRDVSLALNVTTNAKEDGKPFTITTKFMPLDATFPTAAVEGAWDGRDFKGAMRLDPQQPTEGKASAEGALKPLTVQAKIEASAERVSFLQLRIAPADRKDSGTLVEGDAIVEFGKESRAVVDLKSPRINLDTLMGPSAMANWRDGGLLALANQMLTNVPTRFVVDYKLNVNVLTSGGQALNAVRLSGSMQPEAIRVHEFAAEFPGRSSGVFDGVLFPDEGAARLGGKFTFASGDTRAFLNWLAPDWRAVFQKHWTGSRGRLEVQSGLVDWTKDSFSLSKVAYRFEGMAGQAAFASTWGKQPSYLLEVNAGAIDVDNLVPNGWSVFRDAGLPGLMASLVQQGETPSESKRFVLKAQSIMLNGVSADAVTLDVETSAKGLAIKHFDIGDVGGAQLSGSGAFVDKGDGLEGELAFKLTAAEPRAFLRLVGVNTQGAWTQLLGQTSVDAVLKALPQKSGPELALNAKGTSGGFDMTLAGRAIDLEKGRNATLDTKATLKSNSSAAFAQIFGLRADNASGAAEASFALNGSTLEGFTYSLTISALAAMAELEGTLRPEQAFWGVSGKIQVKADDGNELVLATGLPLPSVAGQPLLFAAKLAVKDDSLTFNNVTGNVAGHRFSGTASVSGAREIQADLESDALDMREALMLAFMPWQGQVAGLDQSFADLDAQRYSGAVYIRPLQFGPLTAPPQQEVVAGFGFSPTGRQLTITAPGEQGIRADISMTPKSASFDLAGEMRWPVDVAKVVAMPDGSALAKGDMLLQGEFKANGRSPAAALAAVEGKGNFWLSNATLSRMTLEGLASAVTRATSPDELTTALARLDTSPGAKLGQSIGNVSVSNGNMVLSELSPPVEGLDVKIAPQMDLAAGQIKITTTLSLKNRPDLPPFTVSYVGEPAALSVRSGTSALAAKLGYDLLSKDMAALEKLQQEQQALLVKEEAQRSEDEKRFAAYQETRAELREQVRIRRFHQQEREKSAVALRAITDQAIKSGNASARVELLRHARRVAINKAVAFAKP
jgi:AsmA family